MTSSLFLLVLALFLVVLRLLQFLLLVIVLVLFLGAAAEALGVSRADDASESGVGSMKSGGFTQLGERSAAGAVVGDSADDNDAVATSDLVVRQKDLAHRTSMPPEN